MLVLSRQGSVSLEEIADNFCAAAAEAAFAVVEKILIDHSQSDFSGLTSENIIAIAHLYRDTLQGRKVRVAVLSPGSEKFGLSRMFEQYSGLGDVRVFRDKAEALSWLEQS